MWRTIKGGSVLALKKNLKGGVLKEGRSGDAQRSRYVLLVRCLASQRLCTYLNIGSVSALCSHPIGLSPIVIAVSCGLVPLSELP